MEDPVACQESQRLAGVAKIKFSSATHLEMQKFISLFVFHLMTCQFPEFAK